VTVRSNLASPIVGGRASFDAHDARRNIGKESQYLRPLQLPSDYNLTSCVDGMHLKHAFREIHANGGNFRLGRLLSCGVLDRPHRGTSMPFSGAVHPINYSR